MIFLCMELLIINGYGDICLKNILIQHMKICISGKSLLLE